MSFSRRFQSFTLECLFQFEHFCQQWPIRYTYLPTYQYIKGKQIEWVHSSRVSAHLVYRSWPCFQIDRNFMPDLLFDWYEYDQTSKCVAHSTKAKQLYPKKINRRSVIKWSFPLLSALIILRLKSTRREKTWWDQ